MNHMLFSCINICLVRGKCLNMRPQAESSYVFWGTQQMIVTVPAFLCDSVLKSHRKAKKLKKNNNKKKQQKKNNRK